MKPSKLAFTGCLVLLAVGCARRSPSEQAALLTEEVADTALSFSPAAATAAGFQQYKGRQLDTLLDDNSPANLDRQLHFYLDVLGRLQQLDAGKLTPQDHADLLLIRNQASLAAFELGDVHTHLHSPALYTETLTNALFVPLMVEYAPKPDRLRHIIARLKATPLFLDQASTNLTSFPDFSTRLAIQENDANMALVDKDIRAEIPPALSWAFLDAAEPALAAMRKFAAFLQKGLVTRSGFNWRLGRDLFRRKVSYLAATGVEPDTLLDNATRDLAKVREQVLSLMDSHSRDGLDRVAQRHSTPESFLDDARQDLDEARAHVEQNRLLPLPPPANLRLAATPEFLRPMVPVAMLFPAPALQPRLGSSFWITPISAAWSARRAEDYLKLLVMREAIPGRYLQSEFARAVMPPARRLLRTALGNQAYVDGWEEYAAQAMLDQGFLDHSPEMLLMLLKERLRFIAGAIVDVRLQMLDMTDQEALDLLQTQALQSPDEAARTLERARSAAGRMVARYAGWIGWEAADQEFQRSHKGLPPSEFYSRALKLGAVPLTTLGPLVR